MKLKSLIKSAIEGVQKVLLGDPGKPSAPHAPNYLGDESLHTPPPVVGDGKVEAEADEPAKKKDYDPRKHKTFYVVAHASLRYMLSRPPASYNARELSDVTQYAESTIRGVLKLLAEEGVLQKVLDFPAAYSIDDEKLAQERVKEYAEFAEAEAAGASAPPSEP